jgi:hypothetical protein
MYPWAIAIYTTQAVNLQEMITAMVTFPLCFMAKMQQKLQEPWRRMGKEYTLAFYNGRCIPIAEECIQEVIGWKVMAVFRLENTVVVNGESWYDILRWLLYMVGTVQIVVST